MMERTIEELLALVRDNLEKCFEGFNAGICSVVVTLWWLGKINDDEEVALCSFLESALPKRMHNGYCWEEGEIEPRMKWLNEEIKKLEENDTQIDSEAVTKH